jgi:hypothetical protein
MRPVGVNAAQPPESSGIGPRRAGGGNTQSGLARQRLPVGMASSSSAWTGGRSARVRCPSPRHGWRNRGPGDAERSAALPRDHVRAPIEPGGGVADVDVEGQPVVVCSAAQAVRRRAATTDAAAAVIGLPADFGFAARRSPSLQPRCDQPGPPGSYALTRPARSCTSQPWWS